MEICTQLHETVIMQLTIINVITNITFHRATQALQRRRVCYRPMSVRPSVTVTIGVLLSKQIQQHVNMPYGSLYYRLSDKKNLVKFQSSSLCGWHQMAKVR